MVNKLGGTPGSTPLGTTPLGPAGGSTPVAAPTAPKTGATTAAEGFAVQSKPTAALGGDKFGLAALRPNRSIDFSELEAIPGNTGSNPGGWFEHKETGERFFVKTFAVRSSAPESTGEDRIYNELVSAKLYELAGVEVPELNLIKIDGTLKGQKFEDRIGIASTIIEGKLDFDSGRIKKMDAPGVAENFMVDAWLANWDVMGMSYDNIAIVTDAGGQEKAWRLDVGGALRYRAQGSFKPQFGDVCNEAESMRDPSSAREAGPVYKNMTAKQVEASALKVLRVSDADIRAVVAEYGPRDEGDNKKLADTLIARKRDIAKRFPAAHKLAMAPTTSILGLRAGI